MIKNTIHFLKENNIPFEKDKNKLYLEYLNTKKKKFLNSTLYLEHVIEITDQILNNYENPRQQNRILNLQQLLKTASIPFPEQKNFHSAKDYYLELIKIKNHNMENLRYFYQKKNLYSYKSFIQKKDTVAFLLCLFLGFLGAHWFFIRRFGYGLVYVFLSLTSLTLLFLKNLIDGQCYLYCNYTLVNYLSELSLPHYYYNLFLIPITGMFIDLIRFIRGGYFLHGNGHYIFLIKKK